MFPGVSPDLASWSFGAILTLVVLVSDLAPVGAEDCAATCLVALDHSAASSLISPAINLLEQIVEGAFTLWLVFGEIFLNLLVYFREVGLLLRTCRIGGHWLVH